MRVWNVTNDHPKLPTTTIAIHGERVIAGASADLQDTAQVRTLIQQGYLSLENPRKATSVAQTAPATTDVDLSLANNLAQLTDMVTKIPDAAKRGWVIRLVFATLAPESPPPWRDNLGLRVIAHRISALADSCRATGAAGRERCRNAFGILRMSDADASAAMLMEEAMRAVAEPATEPATEPAPTSRGRKR